MSLNESVMKASKPIKVCAVCSRAFVNLNRKAVYCSDECRKEALRKRRREYYRNHTEQEREYRMEYYRNHAEQKREYSRRYYQKHREELLEHQREYQREQYWKKHPNVKKRAKTAPAKGPRCPYRDPKPEDCLGCPLEHCVLEED